MHSPTCRFCSTLLLVASLGAVSGLACAFDDSIDPGTVSAGPRPPSGGLGLPVSADTLLATTSGALAAGLSVDHTGFAPAAPRSDSTSLAAAAAGVPVRVAIAPMSGSAATGLRAAVSITLTSTSVSDAAGQVVSVGYSIK